MGALLRGNSPATSRESRPGWPVVPLFIATLTPTALSPRGHRLKALFTCTRRLCSHPPLSLKRAACKVYRQCFPPISHTGVQGQVLTSAHPSFAHQHTGVSGQGVCYIPHYAGPSASSSFTPNNANTGNQGSEGRVSSSMV